VEKRPFGARHVGQLPNRLQDTHLIVGTLNRDECRVLINGFCGCVQVHHAVLGHWYLNDFHAAMDERPTWCPDRLVFHCCGDDPPSVARPCHYAQQHQVIAFGRAAREHDFRTAAPNQLSH
jgi:hypothetical protein